MNRLQLRTFLTLLLKSTSLFLLAFFSLIQTEVQGAREVFNSRLAGTISTGATLTATDDKYAYMQSNASGTNGWSNTFTNAGILNRAILRIDHANTAVQQGYTATVQLQITYYTWSGSGFVSTQVSPNPVLQLVYNPTAAYQDQVVYQFAGGNQCVVKVVSVTSTPGVTLSNLALEAEVDVTRYYAFDGSKKINTAHNSLENSRGELEVYWDYQAGAEQYDLEWTYVNDYASDGSPLATANIPADSTLFRFNSTRITTSANYYRIPLIYERGYILYRVRGVGLSAADNFNKNLYGTWSSAPNLYTNVSQFPNSYHLTAGHNPQLNWQNSISFAEDAKKKAVVSYYDGSLRNRQVVSKMNSTDQVIVGETIYDYQGRAAVQVLPVPVNQQLITYQSSFNKNIAGLPYTKSDFDTDINCKVSTAPMDSSSGSSNYYSISNTDHNGQQAYVPLSKGYPFTQVEYTPDNTGRIRAQSGVGDQHILGSGHESRYFYASPMQEELNRLFGGEAGDADHYKKNMVMDANGQISVSYIDPLGRVVATALAGESPAAVQDLGAAGSPLYVDFLTYNAQQIMNNDSLVLNKVLAVSSNNEQRAFSYSLKSPKFLEQCKLVNNVNQSISQNCYDCVLDLSIVLTDECGVNYMVNLDGMNPNSTSVTVGQNILTAMRQGGYKSPDNCSQPNLTFSKDWSVVGPLPVGTYTISKVLKVNEEALDSFQADYLRNGACVLTLQDFLNTEFSKIDTAGCIMTCESCLASIGPFMKYSAVGCNPCLTQDDYNQLISSCDDLCDSSSYDCSSALDMMLIDVGLFGQYGGVREQGDSTLHPETYPLSVFNTSNALPHNLGIPNWQHPILPTLNLTTGKILSISHEYADDDGAPVRIPIQINPQGGYTPAVDDPANIVTVGSNLFIAPQHLANFSDFFSLYQNSWAQSLVVYHPEYPNYLFCVVNNPSHDFDYRWLQANTVKVAPTGYTNPLNDPSTGLPDPATCIDPYFNSHSPLYDATEYALMQYDMEHYEYIGNTSYSIWQMAYATENCPDFAAGNVNNCGNTSFCGAGVTSSTVMTDKVWSIYKSMYYSLKQSFYQRKLALYSIVDNSYNACIGDSTFDIGAYNFSSTQDPDFALENYWYGASSQYFNPQQPCSYMFRYFYKNKSKRFVSQSDLTSGSINTHACDTTVAGASYVGRNCPTVQDAIAQNAKAQAAYNYYNTCNQCAIVLELQTLLDAIVEDGNITKSSFQLSCYPENPLAYGSFVPDIENALNPSGTGPVFWNQQSLSPDKKTLTASFARQSNLAGTANPTITLKLYNSYLLPSTTSPLSQPVAQSFTFSDIKTICCMQAISQATAASGLPTVSGGNFLLDASVVTLSGPQKITIEGYFNTLNLVNCPIPTICTTTTAGSDLQDFLNMLLYSYPAVTNANGSTFPAQNSIFLSNGTAMLLDADITIPSSPLSIYESVITPSLIQYGPQGGRTWQWSSSVNGTMLSGTIQASQGVTGPVSGASLIQLTLPANMPGGAGFSNIVSFTAIRNNPAVTGSTYANSFLIDALVSYGTNQKQYVTLTGFSSSIPVSSCQQAMYKPPGN